MLKILLFLLLFFIKAPAALAKGIDEKIDAMFAPFTDVISDIIFYPISVFGAQVPVSVLWLLVGAIMFTVQTRFIGIWGFKHGLKLLFTKNTKEKNANGEISSYQALLTALSGTVGLGNIAGVAIAITIGGPGAAFWMWIGAILGMAVKFVECTLGVKYRKVNSDGTVSGGPMYYISRGFTKKKMRKLGVILAGVFAVGCLGEALSCGGMFQVKQLVSQLVEVTGAEQSFFYHNRWIPGLVVTCLAAFILFGGIKKLVKTTSVLVPFMGIFYFLLAMAVIVPNYYKVPDVFALIFETAFNPHAIEGGVIGVIIIGLRRAVASNEAGVGSASIAYSSVQTREPISQGFISMLGPFIDTIIFCSLTAFVIIITGMHSTVSSINGVELSTRAFESVIPYSSYLLSIVILLFSFSTLIAWAYYGQKSWNFLFGNKLAVTAVYQVLFFSCIMIGSSMNLRSIVDFSDAMMFLMAVPNIITLYVLFPDIKKDLNKYWTKHNNKTKPEVIIDHSIEETKVF